MADRFDSAFGSRTWVDFAEYIFPVQVTRVVAGMTPYNDLWVYDWTEQVAAPTDGTYSDSLTPRSGTYSVDGNNPGFALNNQRLTPPFFAWMRLRSVANGQLVFEFEQCCGGAAITVTNVCLNADPINGGLLLTVQYEDAQGNVFCLVNPEDCCLQSGSGSGGSGGDAPIEIACCPGLTLPRTLLATLGGLNDPAGCIDTTECTDICSILNASITLTYDSAVPSWKTGLPFEGGLFNGAYIDEPLPGWYGEVDLGLVLTPNGMLDSWPIVIEYPVGSDSQLLTVTGQHLFLSVFFSPSCEVVCFTWVGPPTAYSYDPTPGFLYTPTKFTNNVAGFNVTSCFSVNCDPPDFIFSAYIVCPDATYINSPLFGCGAMTLEITEAP
jgi:hypothetical protein